MNDARRAGFAVDYGGGHDAGATAPVHPTKRSHGMVEAAAAPSGVPFLSSQSVRKEGRVLSAIPRPHGGDAYRDSGTMMGLNSLGNPVSATDAAGSQGPYGSNAAAPAVQPRGSRSHKGSAPHAPKFPVSRTTGAKLHPTDVAAQMMAFNQKNYVA